MPSHPSISSSLSLLLLFLMLGLAFIVAVVVVAVDGSVCPLEPRWLRIVDGSGCCCYCCSITIGSECLAMLPHMVQGRAQAYGSTMRLNSDLQHDRWAMLQHMAQVVQGSSSRSNERFAASAILEKYR